MSVLPNDEKRRIRNRTALEKDPLAKLPYGKDAFAANRVRQEPWGKGACWFAIAAILLLLFLAWLTTRPS